MISIAIWVKKMQNYNNKKTWIYQIVLVFGVSSFDFNDSRLKLHDLQKFL